MQDGAVAIISFLKFAADYVLIFHEVLILKLFSLLEARFLTDHDPTDPPFQTLQLCYAPLAGSQKWLPESSSGQEMSRDLGDLSRVLSQIQFFKLSRAIAQQPKCFEENQDYVMTIYVRRV